MKLIIKTAFVSICFFSLTLVSISKAEAKKSNSPPRLEQYMIDTKVDFEWMTETERASYVAFLVNLNLILDIELNRDNAIVLMEEKRKESRLEFYKLLFEGLFHIEEANAVVFPLALAAPVVTRAVTPYVVRYAAPYVRQAAPYVREAASRTTSTTAKMMKEWDGKFTDVGGSTLKRVAGFFGAGSTAAYVGHTILDSEPDAAAGPNPGQAVAPGSAAPTSAAASAALASAAAASAGASGALGSAAPAPASAAPVAEAAATGDIRAPGSFCIFGGHGSKYIKVGEKNVCPAPKDTVDNALCAAKKISPSFLCQSFGLTQGKSTLPNLDNLCIPLRSDQGLRDLTVRCAAAFTTFAATITQMDVAKVTEIQGQIKNGIAALEKERGIGDVGLVAYCQDKNKLNRGLQVSECQALGDLLKQFKKDFPKLAQHTEQRGTRAAPTAPAGPASAPQGVAN